MSAPHTRFAFWVAAALLIAAGGCTAQDEPASNLDTLDAELTNGVAGNARDPAVASALEGQIMVDPALVSQANDDAIRPPAQPLAGAVPAGSGAAPGAAPSGPLQPAPAAIGDCPQCRVARQSLTLGALAGHGKDAGCTSALRYSAAYATRLPAALPLYPDARVSEAAGSDAAGCTLRAVSFVSSAGVQAMLDWYATQARKGGYSAGHQADGGEHVLAGTRGEAAFTLFVTARAGGGTDVDLVTNADR